MSIAQYSAKLIVHQKTVRRLKSNNYSTLLANVVFNLESHYPTGIGFIRDNHSGSVINRIKCASIVD